jgi:hypothetical protein
MSNDDSFKDRDVLFRRALVRMAQRSPIGVRGVFLRNVTAVAIASIAAFALAGALTGGGIASASAESARQATADATARFAALDFVNRNDGKVIGSPILKSATKTLTLTPRAPKGANYSVFGLDCLDAGHFDVEFPAPPDGGSFDCTDARANSREPIGYGSGGWSSGEKSAFVKISASTNARFTIWFAWVHPTLKASAQERKQIAAGPISREGLVTALNRYSSCMAALGYNVGPMSGTITPGFPSVPQAALKSGADHRCELTEENQIGEIWYTEIENGDVAAASVTACLLKENLTPEGTPSERAAQLATADLNWQTDCAYLG